MSAVREFYRTGEHPTWCELGNSCSGESDPRHIGRTSTIWAQGSETQISVQLVRIDNAVAGGTWTGTQ